MTSPQQVDDDWARRVSSGIAAGSRDALSALFAARFDFLLRVARDRTRRDESFGLDCVQDAMVKIARSLPPFDSLAALDSWLRRTILHAALDRIRAERSRAARDAAHGNESERDDDDERIAALQAELDRLPADERHFLWLRFRRGLTLAQIATHTGKAPKAIDSRIRRALARLRVRLGAPTREEIP
ncbi:MAG: sigma-70 family RNA polymerase sigma factor [Phycisphaerales bacterium]